MDNCRSETRTSPNGGELSADQNLKMAENMCTAWTDEKHSMYLKSMEASFVNQLYNSMDHFDLQLKKDISHSNLSHKVHSSYQFKVLRGRCWKSINFLRPDSPSMPNEPRGAVTSPWIQHFRSSRKTRGAVHERPALQTQASNSSKRKSGYTAACSKDSVVDSNTEVSDQNFVDENVRSGTWSLKRIKTRKTCASIDDQVVPYSEPLATEDIDAAAIDGSQSHM